jgi:hypothetical protein
VAVGRIVETCSEKRLANAELRLPNARVDRGRDNTRKLIRNSVNTKGNDMNVFKRIHRDVYSLTIAILVFGGLIAWLLVTVNPIR